MTEPRTEVRGMEASPVGDRASFRGRTMRPYMAPLPQGDRRSPLQRLFAPVIFGAAPRGPG
jgi:hypothetical protein